jgi:hypothetical protein
MIDKEYRAIRQAIQESGFRERFSLESEWAVRVEDLIPLLIRKEPTIIHFSGHGSEDGEIVLEDESGNPFPLRQQAVQRIFGILNSDHNQVRCVILNACFSEDQARLISKHVDIVIGISSAIGDVSARKFASVFYATIGEKQNVNKAFELARTNISLHGLDYKDAPKLLARQGVDPGRYCLT